MSRALAAMLLAAALALPGCVSPPAVEISEPPPPVIVTPAPPPVLRWLRWQDSVATMSAEQLTTTLEGIATPGNPNQLFYYGLLTQQSDTYDGWVSARDIFRQLNQDQTLTTGQRRLAGLLERYNQSRINWFHSRDELQTKHEQAQEQLGQLKEQNRLLEQKIKVITELEATISTRKEE